MENPPAQKLSIRLALACVFVVLIASLFPYLWETFRPPPEIRFVLPVGFRGGFVIRAGADGVDLGGRYRNLYIVTVPESRVATVTSFAPFQVMHTESIQFGDNGPVSAVNLVPEDADVALRGLGTHAGSRNGRELGERVGYFLGSATEAEKFDVYSVPAD